MIVEMNDPQPLYLTELCVESEWIDYNGHMNVGYYGVAFDRAADLFTDRPRCLKMCSSLHNCTASFRGRRKSDKQSVYVGDW